MAHVPSLIEMPSECQGGAGIDVFIPGEGAERLVVLVGLVGEPAARGIEGFCLESDADRVVFVAKVVGECELEEVHILFGDNGAAPKAEVVVGALEVKTPEHFLEEVCGREGDDVTGTPLETEATRTEFCPFDIRDMEIGIEVGITTVNAEEVAEGEGAFVEEGVGHVPFEVG